MHLHVSIYAWTANKNVASVIAMFQKKKPKTKTRTNIVSKMVNKQAFNCPAWLF
jgi:hypothetical protein